MAARFNFNLRDAANDNQTPIHLITRYDKNRIVFHTGNSVSPKYWDKKKQKAIITNKYPEHAEINTSLENILREANNSFLRFENENKRKPTKEECKKLIYENVLGKGENGKPEKKEEINLFSFIDKLIAETWVRLKTKGTYRKGNTIADSYRQTKNLLKEYSRHKKIKIDYDTIDLEFYYDFIEYMETIKKYSTNNIGKHIKVVKT